MKRTLLILATALLLTACVDSKKQLIERATELCKYIPDHELQEQSRGYMTEDFYAVLDTMFNHLPNHEAMDHEWLYYFVTGNGGTIADYTVVDVKLTDKTHAVATISVRQRWEDGSFDPESDTEEHRLYMEKVDGRWLMSDFDEHKADCIRHIAINREEQAVRKAISDYLVREIGEHYQKGELCIPTLMMVHEDSLSVYGDFWVFWYNQSGDTLKCVSGGNHSGLMTLEKEDGAYRVLSFEQTVDGAGNQASAKRIFVDYYDIYETMHSNKQVREAVRKEQLGEYVKRHNLPFRYYQDYGWPAVEL
ncbi:MAG: hypothetical protein J6X86_04830 [Bacteroidales bacterium]|nr:hypothetical protein [Bacteroidales bacterium]